MSGYLRGEISIGLVGCRRDWEIDLPEDWNEMDEDDRLSWRDQIEEEMIGEYVECYSEVVNE